MNRSKQLSFFVAGIFTVLTIILLYYNPQIDLGTGNFLTFIKMFFNGVAPLIISILAAITYLEKRISRAMFLCCSMLMFGLGTIISGVLGFIYKHYNAVITVYEVCIFICAFLYLFASIYEPYIQSPQYIKRSKKPIIILFPVSVIFLFIFLLAFFSLNDLTSPFIDINGYTVIRYSFQFSAIALFFASSMIYAKEYIALRSNFYFWCAISTYMLTLGLFGGCVATSLGSPLGWVGRISQLLWAAYAFLSLKEVYDKATQKGSPFVDVAADLFSDLRDAALFMHKPARLEDLVCPRPVEDLKEYIIEKTIVLDKIDYENFIEDMSVERGFFEEYSGLCSVDNDEVWHLS
jgi:MFS family permease